MLGVEHVWKSISPAREVSIHETISKINLADIFLVLPGNSVDEIEDGGMLFNLIF